MQALHDVIVIGGGLSGLTTAYTLNKYQPEVSTIVLEAKGTYCER